MKKLIVVLIILLTSYSYSQNRFIEVEVKDSIHVKATSFEYLIGFHSNMNSFLLGLNEKKGSEKIKLPEIENILKKGNYNFKKLNDENFEINSDIFSNKAILVTLDNLNQLESLTNQLKSFENITGFIYKLNYEETDSLNERLFLKLIQKATSKAKLLADLTKLRLNGIIEIKEIYESENFLEKISQMDVTTTFIERNSQIIKNEQIYAEISKTLLIKFEVEK